MPKQDILQLEYLSLLQENSYVRMDVYTKGESLYKCVSITEEHLKQLLMPYLLTWDVSYCFHHNQLKLFFPFGRERILNDVVEDCKSLDEVLMHLQKLFLTIHKSNIPTAILPVLCSQKNLSLREDGTWNLYANPHFEYLGRNYKTMRAWQMLCAEILDQAQHKLYPRLPTPVIFTKTLSKFKNEQTLSIHETLTLLMKLMGCYKDIKAPVKPYKKIFRGLLIFLLILMIVLSIVYFVYEYIKQRQEYFREIDKIGDVVVNKNE